MTFPASAPTVLHDFFDVARLVDYLRSEARTRPVAVLTTAPGQYAPYVKAAELARAVGGGVDIVTIPDDDLTRTMSNRLANSKAGVYQGACRVYPPGTHWETDPYSTPLRFARTADEIEAQFGQVVLDAKQVLSRAAEADRSMKHPRWASPVAPSPSLARPSALASGGPAMRRSISTFDDASALAAFLHSSARRLPAVVVSRAAGATEAYADVQELEMDLEGMAAVFEIVSLDASWAFTDAVPDKCQVYGGAARVYPPGTVWESDPHVSPLHFAYSLADRAQITRALVGDAMRMATSGSLSLPVAAARPRTVTGQVHGVVAERGMVRLTEAGHGVLWPELVEPGVAAERLFGVGMRIEGALDPDSRRIDVRGMRRAADEALAGYRAGDTVLVRIIAVEAAVCTVEPFPGCAYRVVAEDVAEDAGDLRELLTEGEVIPALLVEVASSGEWLLSVREAAESTDAVPAPSILTGGPAWLVPVEPTQPVTEGTEPVLIEPELVEQQPVAPQPSARTQASPLVEELQREKAQLVSRLEEGRAEKARLQADLQSVRAQLRKTKNRKGRGEAALDDSNLFVDPADQLDFEIRLAWARMTSPSEKKSLPLKRWTYGPEFLHTLREVEGVSRNKVVRVIVHVLTGRDTELASRELHQLRSGLGADDPSVRRARGELCWRVSLQSNTPAARRLHYWSGADGTIELSSVRVHDDFRP